MISVVFWRTWDTPRTWCSSSRCVVPTWKSCVCSIALAPSVASAEAFYDSALSVASAEAVAAARASCVSLSSAGELASPPLGAVAGAALGSTTVITDSRWESTAPAAACQQKQAANKTNQGHANQQQMEQGCGRTVVELPTYLLSSALHLVRVVDHVPSVWVQRRHVSQSLDASDKNWRNPHPPSSSSSSG